MNSNLPYAVHISRDGRLHINGEPTVTPDGVDPSQVVLRILHMEAAASGTPLLANVRDDLSGSVFDFEVMPDGTTQPPTTPTAPETPTVPTAPVTDDLALRLTAAQAAARANDFDTAVPAADAILQGLAATLGDTAPSTLKAAQFRADLAVLEGDYAHATASWTWLALTWYDTLGPGRRRTQVAAGNAAWSWMQLPPDEAAVLAPDLLSMLNEVATPNRTQTMRAQIETRLRHLTP
ncbi:hypothetical protein ACFTXJ_00750 [Streptomyces zhihengii]|uniref:hypothetical protein n=1 Tax=Streptomyces zhihengii TaxID=1818004 RepID=UPI003630975A